MNLKYKVLYVLKFLFGILIIPIILLALYYLWIFFSESWLEFVIGPFFIICIISALRVIPTIPTEYRILIEILKSDSPKEVDDYYSDLRMKNKL